MGAQSSSKMQGLLVLASLAVASAQVLPLGYHGLGLGYAGIVHPYTAHVVKPVVKEVEVPVTTLKFEVAETGCKNSFGNPVPCKREAAEDAVESVLRPLLLRLLPPQLLSCLLDFPSDTLVLDTTVLDSLLFPMLPLPSPRLRSHRTSSSPRRRLLSCSPPARMPGDSEYLVPKLYLSNTFTLLVC